MQRPGCAIAVAGNAAGFVTAARVCSESGALGLVVLGLFVVGAIAGAVAFYAELPGPVALRRIGAALLAFFVSGFVLMLALIVNFSLCPLL